MSLINRAVGKRAPNEPPDVKVVQRLLNKHPLPPLRELTVDGVSGPNTEQKIRHFQEVVVKMKAPDSRVDPGGATIRHLNRGPKSRAASDSTPSSSTSARTSKSSQLSGASWWRANQAKYRNRTGLEFLKGSFKENATRFVSALREAGASVSIGSTLRDKTRAHLMHYSWRVSKGNILAKDVPSLAGLSINWDHGDDAKSRKAAGDMVRLFRMAHIASLTSNHIRGLAVDMTISWNGQLVIDVAGKDKPVVISSGPRTGAGNRELHRVGREFGVLKLVSDPPHWSHNGR